MFASCCPVFRIVLIIFLNLAIVACSSFTVNETMAPTFLILKADRVFDGEKMLTNSAVLIKEGRIESIGPQDRLTHPDAAVLDLGETTLLPGFIELHAHLSFKKVPSDVVLRHGITTLRDVGGPVHQPYGGDGKLRVLTSGPIITALNGYPIVLMGDKNIAIAVSSESKARRIVRDLIDGGATIIKIALEPGGEPGAPWSSGHHHGNASVHQHGRHHNENRAWPMLSESIVKAIVDEAHQNNRKVTAHIGEVKGVEIALNAGVDEWAHMPCNAIPDGLLKQAVKQRVKIVTTIDTLSKCNGIFHNAKVLAALGAELFYGAEIAHADIPWGIDAKELMYLKHQAKMSGMELLRTATSKAGQQLGLPLLGTLQQGAPADIIAVKGNPLDNLKSLEYPDLVISGGKIIVNNFLQ